MNISTTPMSPGLATHFKFLHADEKLSDLPHNYVVWRYKIELIAGAMGVKDHLTEPSTSESGPGSVSEHATTSGGSTSTKKAVEKDEDESWRERDEAAKLLIILNISDKILMTVDLDTSASAYSIWDTLAKRCKNMWNLHEKVSALTSLTRFPYEEGQDMRTHVDQLKSRYLDYLNTGISTPGLGNFRDFLYSSLPESYISFVREEHLASADTLIKALVAESERRKIMDANDAPTAGGSTATLRCPNPNCGKNGHTLEQCWAPGGGREGQRRRKKKGQGRDGGPTQPSPSPTPSPTHLNDNLPLPEYAETHHFSIGDMGTLDNRAGKWVFSSSTSNHMTFNRDLFSTFRSCSVPIRSHGRELIATGVGDIRTVFTYRGRTTRFVLRNVLYSPTLVFSLMSVGQLAKEGYEIVLEGGLWQLKDGQGAVFVTDDKSRIVVRKEENWDSIVLHM